MLVKLKSEYVYKELLKTPWILTTDEWTTVECFQEVKDDKIILSDLKIK